MIDLSKLEVWFITGSQSLYGESTLRQVDANARQIVDGLNAGGVLPVRVVFKPVVKTPEEIVAVCHAANTAPSCAGVVCWMHTFSPSRMWISGLKALVRPMLHLHTQFNRDIPWGEIDMDFMNLNQSAHGDREFGHLVSRMRLERKVVVGHWKEEGVQQRVGAWIRAAAAWHDWQGARFCRFGDNMREVAVTEGDKVEAQLKFGYAVNGYGVGELVKAVDSVSDAAVDKLVEEYDDLYTIAQPLRRGAACHQALRDAARIELGLRAFLVAGDFRGFTDTFEDLHGLVQLPGIAVQRLMAEGYGFGAEGDWKTSALVRAMKVMAHGLAGGNSFMEDYTYHLEPANPMVLGSHMLEICPSIASGKPSCEIHPLGIGGKSDPVRLVFNAPAGAALNASVIDMGNRFRLLVNTVDAVTPPRDLPRLPVARALWKPHPDLPTACAAWILAGGAHHTCYSQNLTVEHLDDFASMAGIELVVIDQDTKLRSFRKELQWNDRFYR